MPRFKITALPLQHKATMLELIGNPPLLTIAVFITCLLIFFAQQFHSFLPSVCLLPARVLSRFEIYRLVTFPYFHAGFFHILFNMIAWMFIGKDFERTLGTLSAAYNISILFVPFSAILHCIVAFALDALVGTHFRNECVIGLSGVLFSILVFNLHVAGHTSVRFFGLVDIPSTWYPWILAILLQLFSPRLSLLGHLSGIALGYALSFGWLRNLSPSDTKIQDIEEDFGLIYWPLWQSQPSSFGNFYGTGLGLPQTTHSSASFGERCQAAWQKFTSWFGQQPVSSTQQFTGQGHSLGGAPLETQTRRIPPTSRLLREAENLQSETQNRESDVEEHVSEDPQSAPKPQAAADEHDHSEHTDSNPP